MADKKKKQPRRRMWLVDPIYRKFTAKAFQQLTSPEFFNFFMSMLKNGEQQFQFSNRKLKIDVDEEWISIIEDTFPAFVEITRNPRVIITQEELVTNVVQAKKIDSAVVRHLCSHSYLIDALDENGDVVPSKVLNIFKEETWDTYENRFVNTLLHKTFDFITKRYQDMKDAMSDEFGANLIIDATGNSKMETIEIHSHMKIRQTDEMEEADGKKKSAFARVAYLYECYGKLMTSRFAKEMAKFSKVYPPLVPTNAIKKNPYLRKCHKLWDFLLRYSDAGFTVEIIEQNPEINQKFEQDIFDNIMFTYLILKGYLEDNRDRAMDRNLQARRRTLRPKYIKEIIEEIVQDFNMSDVEVRKILIEELTKEQLLREEREERYRLIDEQRRLEEERRRQAEMERARIQKEKEREARLRAKKREQERARKEREKAKEALRIAKEKERKAAADAKRLAAIEDELRRQMENIERLRERRNKDDDTEAENAVNTASGSETAHATKKPRKAAVKKKASNGKTKKNSAKKAPEKKKPTAQKAERQTIELPEEFGQDSFGAGLSAAERSMSDMNQQMRKHASDKIAQLAAEKEAEDKKDNISAESSETIASGISADAGLQDTKSETAGEKRSGLRSLFRKGLKK